MLKNVITEINNWAWKFGGKYGFISQRIIVNKHREPLKIVFRNEHGTETGYPVVMQSNKTKDGIHPQNVKSIKISVDNDKTIIVNCKGVVLR
jgi:hypothetical protein